MAMGGSTPFVCQAARTKEQRDPELAHVIFSMLMKARIWDPSTLPTGQRMPTDLSISSNNAGPCLLPRRQQFVVAAALFRSGASA
jgi:hypothetical protein